ncbi:MAG TPA: flagellar motor switch protein FliN [Solirubrobacteraceae bacterium]|nr:flagellar motor switch protein FliN [Solirubrobacteraceae bacterium]
MAEAIEYEQFEHTAAGVLDGAAQAASSAQGDLSRLSDIPMELSVEIGRTHMTVGETLDLHVGSVVALERLAGETADLLVNGSAIARGEVVVIDEQYGLRITEILDGQVEGALAPEGEPPSEPASSPPAEQASAADGASSPERETQDDTMASPPASSPEGEEQAEPSEN